MSNHAKQNFLSGAAVLAATVALTKVIGAIYKIPLFNLLGDEGTAHFNAAYQIYGLLLSISTAGIPAAFSRLVSASLANGGQGQVRRYLRVGLVLFTAIGVVGMAAMFLWPQALANLIGDPEIAHCIQVLAPAVLFSCVVSVYRGYTQGHSNMIPTAISQILEVCGKLVVGLALAWLFLRMGFGSADISAAAIVGVTVGLGAAIPVLVIYCVRNHHHPVQNTGVPEAMLSKTRTTLQLLRVSIPITLSSSLASIIAVIDTKLIYTRLQNAAGFTFEESKILYGVYSKGLTLFNLPNAIIVPLAVSVVPAIAAAVATNRRSEARGVMESATRVMNLIAMPACAGMLVLAGPIFAVLFPDSHILGPLLLQILMGGAYFICVELVTNGFLQASGHERMLLFTSVAGSLIKVALDWILVGNPSIGIVGAPIGNFVCYGFITVVNFVFIRVKMGDRLNYGRMFLRPLLCTVVMSAAAWAAYGLCAGLLGRTAISGRLGELAALALAVLVGIVVYALLVVLTRAVTREDLLLLPKGDRIAAKLRIR